MKECHAYAATRSSGLSESFFPNSLGAFYSAATEFCGFKPNYDEGKTMGLAPFGDPKRFLEFVSNLVCVCDDGRVVVDQTFFDFPRLGGRFCGERFLAVCGNPRKVGEDLQDHHRDVAAAFQVVLEQSVVKLAKVLRAKTGERNLVHSGGVALNSVANGKILEAGIFDDIFMMPGAGDNGTSVGAAAFIHNHLEKADPKLYHSTPFLGKAYGNSAIRAALDDAKLDYSRPDNVAVAVAEALHQGKIVGWFQGRMEFGPRALGARSILANPTIPSMKAKLNNEVKHREEFRPFAPAINKEYVSEYFEIGVEVPYMLKVAIVRPEVRSAIPAVVHVDGTARLQTVDATTNPLFHALIDEFLKRSGHPVLLNTSFNVMGEPIVESPVDALRCFFSTGIDLLSIGEYIVEKRKVREVPIRSDWQPHGHREPAQRRFASDLS